MLKYSFRPAKSDDIKSLKDITKQVIKNNYSSFLGLKLIQEFIDSGQFDREIEEGFSNCTLMFHENDIIGFAITKNSMLHLIMIDCNYQNLGYGSKLLGYIEKELFDRYEKINLHSFKENMLANQFYIKNNWIITGEFLVEGIDKIMLIYEKVKE